MLLTKSKQCTIITLPYAGGVRAEHCCQPFLQNFQQNFLRDVLEMDGAGVHQNDGHRQTHPQDDTFTPVNYTMIDHCKCGQLVSLDTHQNGEEGNCVKTYIRRLRDAAPMPADIAI